MVALLAVAFLAALAVGLIGGGTALAHRGLGPSVPPTGSAAVVREVPIEPVPVPHIAPDADFAQPVATF